MLNFIPYKQKNILLYHFFFNHNTNKKTKITLFYVKFFVELISILVNVSVYFNYDFDFYLFYIST